MKTWLQALKIEEILCCQLIASFENENMTTSSQKASLKYCLKILLFVLTVLHSFHSFIFTFEDSSIGACYSFGSLLEYMPYIGAKI
jgi:hypothetical protein